MRRFQRRGAEARRATLGNGAGWAGSTITLNGRTAVQLNGELYYLTMTHQQGMYIPKGGSTSSLYLFKADDVKKGCVLTIMNFQSILIILPNGT